MSIHPRFDDNRFVDRPVGALTYRRAKILADLRKAHDRVKEILDEGGKIGGMSGCRNLAMLRSTQNTLTSMFYDGLVNGYGTPDRRGTGNTPDSSWWAITQKGLRVLREHEGNEA